MSWPFIVLLALAVALVAAAEWERLGAVVGSDGRRARGRKRRKANLKLIRPEDDVDDFEASVQRDLESLPTIEERENR